MDYSASFEKKKKKRQAVDLLDYFDWTRVYNRHNRRTAKKNNKKVNNEK